MQTQDTTPETPQDQALDKRHWGLDSHPGADVFPLMKQREIDDLARDIRDHGQLEPIILDERGAVVDGRNRLAACHRAGITPQMITLTDQEFAERYGGILNFLVSKNLTRRHLSTSQRSMVAGRLANLRNGQKKADRPATEISVAQAEAAEQTDVSVDSVQMAQKVIAEGTPELQRAVDSGTLAVSAAKELVTLPPEDQTALAQNPARAKQVTSAKRAEKKAAKTTPPKKASATPSTTKTTDEGPHPHAKVIDAIVALIIDVPRGDWTDLWDHAFVQATAALKDHQTAEVCKDMEHMLNAVFSTPGPGRKKATQRQVAQS